MYNLIFSVRRGLHVVDSAFES